FTVHDRQYRARSLGRVSQLLAAFVLTCLAYGVEQRVIVRNAAWRSDHRPAGPVGTKGARRHGSDRNTKMAYFFTQHFRNPFQRELAATVVGDTGHGNESAHGRNVDNMPATTFAHSRKDSLYHCHRTIDVNIKLPLHFMK